ncbi:MAG: P1 family peptidase [Woeseiaceae bacterium]|jgi:L-aminopeptidase/D-esterase-like protein|nr:P1 family peptidase [Woeseiaceae bacterium]
MRTRNRRALAGNRILTTALLATLLLQPATDVVAEAHDPNEGLEPLTEFTGPSLEFDFPGLLIGVAEYAEGPTGTTAFYFPDGVMGSVDVRGGAPGTLNTDILRLGYEEPFVSAVVLSGGSAYGLGAATGAAQEIKSVRKDPGWWTNVAVATGAIIFDLGGRRYNAVTPDERLGRAALKAAREGYFPLGARGAGRFALQGAYYGARQYSGQGGAFGTFGDVRIATFTVVNSLGGIVDRDGRFVRCGKPARANCPSASSVLREPVSSTAPAEDSPAGLTTNTTISLVVTNQKMSFAELQRFGMQVHTSMARAIQPFHTINDGDTLFAVTTGEVQSDELSVDELGAHASELMWDAVLSSVPPLPERPAPSEAAMPVSGMARYTGTYRFAPGMESTVSIQGGSLVISAPRLGSMYLPEDSITPLKPATNGDFLLETDRADTLRFEVDRDGEVTGLTLNPGHWPVRATRL